MSKMFVNVFSLNFKPTSYQNGATLSTTPPTCISTILTLFLLHILTVCSCRNEILKSKKLEDFWYSIEPLTFIKDVPTFSCFFRAIVRDNTWILFELSSVLWGLQNSSWLAFACLFCSYQICLQLGQVEWTWRGFECRLRFFFHCFRYKKLILDFPVYWI